MQNIVVKGFDNEMVLKFTFTGDYSSGGLNNFDSLEATIGGEVYSTTTTPDSIFIEDDTTLYISIGDSTQLDEGYYHLKLVGFSGTYDDGFVLACGGINGLPRIQVVEC